MFFICFLDVFHTFFMDVESIYFRVHQYICPGICYNHIFQSSRMCMSRDMSEISFWDMFMYQLYSIIIKIHMGISIK